MANISILSVIIHFSSSLTQLICALAILGLQITLTVTETCAFRIGVGFWAFPFVVFSSISIWILLWKRNVLCCFLAFIFHICATLFATTIILIGFLALIDQIGSECSSSSRTNRYFLSINISLMGVALLLKCILYIEILFLYFLRRQLNDSSAISDKEMFQIRHNDQALKGWTPFRSIIDSNRNELKDFDI